MSCIVLTVNSPQAIIIHHHHQELWCHINQDLDLNRLICHFSVKDQDLFACVAAWDAQPEFLIKRITSFAQAYVRVHNVPLLEAELARCLNTINNQHTIMI